VATTQEANGKVGFKVWLLEGDFGGKQGHEQTHKIKLRLEPPQLPDGSPFNVSGKLPEGIE
jgi:hypothetical protein